MEAEPPAPPVRHLDANSLAAMLEDESQDEREATKAATMRQFMEQNTAEMPGFLGDFEEPDEPVAAFTWSPPAGFDAHGLF